MRGKNLRLYLFGAVFLILATYTSANNGKITPSKCSYTASNKVADEQCQVKNHKGLVSTKPAHPFFRDDIEKENEIENLEDNLPITGDPVRVGFSYSRARVICRRKSFDDEVVRKWVLQAKEDNIYANYDLRKEWGSKCPSIREISNQANCNSCWAVVSTSVMTDRLCISRNGTNNTDRYSVMDLMTCCTNCVRVGKNALCGKDGIQERAWEYWLHNDIASGGFYHDPHYTCLPYPIAPCDSNSSIHSDFHLSDGNRMPKCEALGLSSYNGSCPTECDKTHHKKTQYFLPRGSTCYKLIRKNGRQGVNSSAKAEDGIKMEIFKYGPVQAVIQSDLLSSYVPGTIFDSKVQDSAHSVRIVGWGEEIGAVQNQSYWIVANSWGSEWGMNGFFHLAFTYKGLDEIYAGRY